MQFKKLRSTQKHKHPAADGHVHRSPSGHRPIRRPPEVLEHFPSGNDDPTVFGPRTNREVKRLTNITVERARTNAHRLAHRVTKFITNFHGQVKIPRNLLSRDRLPAGDQPESERRVDVGQIPED